MTTSYATCPLCEACCGVAVEHDGGRIVSIRGDDDDPMSRGYVCPKAVALKDVSEDPDRVRRPLRRDGDRWVEIGWDEALGEVAARFAELQAAHGRDAVAVYIGNPSAHDYAALLYGQLLLKTLGTRRLFTSNSADALPRLLTSYLLYGSQAVIPIPDLDRTDHLLILGANPLVSNGSVMTAPDARRRLRAIRERGGRVVVVDPRRTETAAVADAHHFIRPGMDAAFLAAMLQTIFAEGLAAPGRLAGLVDGLERVRAAVAPFTPERVAARVGIAAETIRGLARDFARARTAVCYGRMGTCTQEHGTVATWLIDCLHVATGNLDREGGAMFTTPAVDLAGLAARLGQGGSFGRWRSRKSGLPEFNGELPVASLAEEIETPGEGQVRGMLVHAGNPVLSVPNGRRLDAAFAKLDFLVAIDLYVNETTRHAHLILPPTFGLEHDHYPVLFGALSVRNGAKLAPAVLPAPEGVRHGWEILLELSARLLERRGGLGRLGGAAVRRAGHAVGPLGVLRLLLQLGPHRRRASLGALRDAPHGIDLGPLAPRLERLLGGDRREVDLAPALLAGDLGRLAARLDGPAEPELVLIGRRQLRSNNSWMHNTTRLVKGPARCTLLVHPDDAARRGLADGGPARVASRIGAIDAVVEVSDEIMPGVISLPHGWGHDRPGVRLGVAAEHAGVSVNDVIDDARVDGLSGCSSLTGIPVTVERPA